MLDPVGGHTSGAAGGIRGGQRKQGRRRNRALGKQSIQPLVFLERDTRPVSIDPHRGAQAVGSMRP